MAPPSFNPQITLGNVITLAGMCIAALGAWYGMKSEVQAMREQFTRIEQQTQQIPALRERIAVLEVLLQRRAAGATRPRGR